MQLKPRTAPDIRDHETLRLIGRGAFGEVWMARSVTGMLRAVKVVWREDYDRPDSFEREFEAIKRFEPISRRHEALVPILQVGRNDHEGFYYYVMELADDLEHGRDIHPDTYLPHTLGLQMKRDKCVPAEQCIQLGVTIAEGLDYLHRNQLIHRDVKPSNLIFIDGICRLADIGLVALLGQRSFVGTEGFVAPEGPGTAASDIFSLGMVLYEASTGKDRLDFPDLPSCTETGASLEIWRRLQDVVCTACAPKARGRFISAREMALALRGQPLPSSRRLFWTWVVSGSVALLLAVGFGMWLAQSHRTRTLMAMSNTVPRLKIVTTPPGAVVFAGEDQLGVTPLELNPAEGVPVIYQLRLPGYKQVEIDHIALDEKPAVFELKLEPSRLPQKGERWVNSLGMVFKPGAGGHISAEPVEMKYFRRFLEATGRSFEGKVVRFQRGKDQESAYLVVVPDGDAEAFRYWLTDRDRSEAYLSQEHRYVVEPFYFVESGQSAPDEMPDGRDTDRGEQTEEKNWRAFHLRVERQTYGSVVVQSQPEKVRVYQHDEFLGETPLELPRVRTGPVEFELREEGFADVVLEGEVREGEQAELFADMQTRKAVTFGRQWKANSLGMNLVPLGDVMFSAWETRHRDYMEYCKATQARRPLRLDGGGGGKGGGGGTLPVVGVDRNEARAFCAWLTERERNAGLIGAKDLYRLPTDEEWSRAVGLPLERGSTPEERNGRIRGIYPWGFDWPPPADVDNFADINGARKAGLDNFIAGYEDKFPFLAPVTALPPNDRGITGLAGNVSEWVETDYSSATSGRVDEPSGHALGTTRGGNWRSATQDELLASARMPVPPDTKRNTIGFRVVLAHGK